MMTKSFESENLEIVVHPAVQHKLLRLRDVNTGKAVFSQLLKEIGLLLGYEITKNLDVMPAEVETPMGKCSGNEIAQSEIVIIPILRAGLGMTDGFIELLPGATVGHIGCYRDEKTKQPVEYMVEIPEYKGQTYIIVDPMLATGNSAKYATDILKRHGVPGKNIRFMALVAAPEGVGRFHEAHPDVYLLVAAVDSHLDENAYIVPGLGDAGDRLFGTSHE